MAHLATKDVVHAPRKSANVAALDALQKDSNDTLMTIRTVWPFLLFPDTVIIDRSKITIIHKTFFATEQINTVALADILNVDATHGPFFGTIKLHTRFFAKKPLVIQFVTRREALRAKELIQGLCLCIQNNIDISAISKEDLLKKIEEIGAP